MDCFELLTVKELKGKMKRRCKERLLYTIPLHTKMTEEEIDILSSFAILPPIPDVCTCFSLFGLEKHLIMTKYKIAEKREKERREEKREAIIERTNS